MSMVVASYTNTAKIQYRYSTRYNLDKLYILIMTTSPTMAWLLMVIEGVEVGVQVHEDFHRKPVP